MSTSLWFCLISAWPERAVQGFSLLHFWPFLQTFFPPFSVAPPFTPLALSGFADIFLHLTFLPLHIPSPFPSDPVPLLFPAPPFFSPFTFPFFPVFFSPPLSKCYLCLAYTARSSLVLEWCDQRSPLFLALERETDLGAGWEAVLACLQRGLIFVKTDYGPKFKNMAFSTFFNSVKYRLSTCSAKF